MCRAFAIVVISVVLQLFVVRETHCKSVGKDEKLDHLREIAIDLKQKLSPEIDPCEDFTGYVCSKTDGGRKSVSSFNKTIEFLEAYLSQAEGLSEVDLKVKYHLESCKHATPDDLLKFAKEFNFPDSIGGWPVFDPGWNPDKFDLQTAIAELNSYFVPVIIDQTFDIDRSTLKGFLSVGLEPLDLILNSEKKQKLTEKISKVGLENLDEVIADGELLEKECEKIIYAEESKDEEQIETDLSGLKSQIPEIDWDKQMELIAGEKLREDYPVVIAKGPLLRRVIQKISQMSPKTVANYFFLHFVYRLPEITNPALEEICPRQAISAVSSAVTGIFLKEYFTEELKPMVYSMLTVLQETFNIFEDLPAGDVTENIAKLLNEEYLPNFSNEVLKAEYEDIQIDPTNYFKNMYALRRHDSRTMVQRMYINKNDNLELMLYLLPTLLSSNLPETINQPSVVAFEALTFGLVVEYIQTVCPRLITDSLRECFNKQLSLKDITDREIFAVTAGNLFVRGYFEWVDKNEELARVEDDTVQEYGLNIKKILLIRLMEYGCGSKDSEATQRIFSFYMNSQQFADAFSCPVGSRLNPVEKCEFSRSKLVD